MFWAACTLGYVGFLHLAEFTVATFSALLHLTVKDIAVNGVLAPFCMHMMINVSKTDPLRGGVHSYWSGCPSSLCSSSHDGISHAAGQCPSPSVYASRWSTAVSCTSH